LRVPVPDGGVLVPSQPPPDLIAIREKRPSREMRVGRPDRRGANRAS